jgi:dipicolinate synthase subunit A
MSNILLYAAGRSPVLRHACRTLAGNGIAVTDVPGPEVTHLLLPVPSFEKDGRIRGGGMLEHILADLSDEITVIGGKLDHPMLAGYKIADLLQDGQYQARNGAITADGAMRIAAQYLDTTFADCSALIIGWGRIGKCLARLLKSMGAQVTVAARKASDRDMLRALDYGAEDPATMRHSLAGYQVIFNTAPEMVLDEQRQKYCRKDCIMIELASVPGIAGDNVIDGRGLPGRLTPASSGQLIARTVIRLIAERRI